MSHDIGQIGARKRDHIRICLDERSQFDRSTRLEDLYFENCALPEVALEDVHLGCEFLGKPLDAPFIVSSMTGGPDEGQHINRHLAEGVAAAGLGMGVGSQRVAIEHPETAASFEVRKYAPNIPLFANLGAVQLNYGYGKAEAERAVEMIGADGLFLHLNALQEAVQEEGDTNFRGLAAKIGQLVDDVSFPVLVKEVGAGISATTLVELVGLGVAAVDVAGAGGTSWAKVEGARASSSGNQNLGEMFGNWGIPTAVAIKEGRAASLDATIIASGGLRSGLDIAKTLALGANIASVAQPVLQAARESGEAVHAVLERIKAELRVVFFLVGAKNLDEFRARARLRT